MRQAALIVISALANASIGADSSEDVKEVITWACYCLAVVVLLGSWAAHERVRPFAFGFQNVMESCLFVSNLLLVGLGQEVRATLGDMAE